MDVRGMFWGCFNGGPGTELTHEKSQTYDFKPKTLVSDTHRQARALGIARDRSESLRIFQVIHDT